MLLEDVKNLSDYKKYKLQVLKELCINLTKEEIKYLKQLKTEIAVDNFCHDLFFRS